MILSEITEKRGIKERYPIPKQKFDQYCVITWKWCETACMLVLLCPWPLKVYEALRNAAIRTSLYPMPIWQKRCILSIWLL